MLRFYVAAAQTAFRRQLIYRWANAAGLLTNVFFGIIFSSVIIALFHARPVVAGYSVRDALRYTWAVQALIMVVLPSSWYDLMLTIRSGDVVSDLSKPCDFHWYWCSREMGRSAYYFLWRSLPSYIIGALIFGLGVPGTWLSWALLLPVLALGTMLGFAYRYLTNLLAFWLIEARSAVVLGEIVAQFFTGSFIPIPLMPPGLRSIVEWLPFSGFINVPAQVALGKLTGWSLWLAIGRQALWLVALTLLARWVTRVAFRRVVVQGG